MTQCTRVYSFDRGEWRKTDSYNRLTNAGADMKSQVVVLLILSAGYWLAPQIRAQGSTNLAVSFTTTNATPLNLGFAGFTADLMTGGEEYGDTNLQQYANLLSPGWVRFPGGTTGDAFNWFNGLTVSSWINELNASNDAFAGTLCQYTYEPLIGKGGLMLTNFASMAANLGGARIIVTINGFTDSSNSAGAFAAYALSNHIPVAAWELCNEPYTLKGPGNFFASGTDYADKMKPYRDAIKAADSNAVVALYFGDPAYNYSVWNNGLTNYSNRYWDAAVYHHYPPLPVGSSFNDLMALDNGILFTNTAFVTDYLIPGNNSNVTFFITEMNPSKGDGNGGQFPPTSTLYGGIYCAEYILRLSAVPRMIFVGSFQMLNGSGVGTTNDFANTVTKAAANGYVTNTVGLPFGYFLSAQGTAEAVAYWALNRSVAVYPTSVGTNCPTVPRDTNGLTTMPAIYAQAYQGGNGKRYVLLTNKGSNAVPAQITQDGLALTNQLLETYVTASDPSTINTNPPLGNVVIRTQMAANPVTVPEYSVVRLEWTAFTVPRPTLSVTVSNAVQDLRWAGLTNVVYNIQAATNLLGAWTTLGRIASPQTNFGFTNWHSGSQQFYRLEVP
jgi:hypothetical protein